MSATLDAERFSRYFGGCPIIKVPRFTHPVKSFYLEEVLSLLETEEKNHLNGSSCCPVEEHNFSKESQDALDEAIEMACSSQEFDTLMELLSSEGTTHVMNYQHPSTGVTPLMVLSSKGRVSDVCTLLAQGANCHIQAHNGRTALDWAMQADQLEVVEILRKHLEISSSSSLKEKRMLEKYISKKNSSCVDVVLVEQLLVKMCMESKEGSILVFLPGWEDINKTRESLQKNPIFKNPSNFAILCLHSLIPQAEQKKVFKRPPPGCRKIILSTNISETAVTIDDVVYVIDCGRLKEKSYDPYNNVSTLRTAWISQASAKQREGRAGRCQPGVCYHLYSRLRAVSLPVFQVPEIKRIPIEELCLQVKILDPNCKVEEFLQKTLDPPVFETMKHAISVLKEIGAFSDDERLTELGEKLGSLPVHPLTSKMLFFAILLKCLDPALTLACASDYKDPFTLSMSPAEKHAAAAAKAELASLYGGHSDQLAVIAAFDCWNNAWETGQESRFCSDYFVSGASMHMLRGMRKQLQNELKRRGFIPGDASSYSMNARDPGIVRAVVLAGSYPMVGRVNVGKQVTVETSSGDKVRLSPSSIISKMSFKGFVKRPLVVYNEVTRGDGGLLTRSCTLVSPLSLLLLAAEIVVAPGKGNDLDLEGDGAGDDDEMEGIDKIDKQAERIMSSPTKAVTVFVDRWHSIESTALNVAQIYCLRERLLAAILFKVTNPSGVLPPALCASIRATACLLSYDGMSGIKMSDESVDYPTSMVHNTLLGKTFVGNRRFVKMSASRRKTHSVQQAVPPSVPVQAVPTPVERPVRPTLLPPQTLMVNNTELRKTIEGKRKFRHFDKIPASRRKTYSVQPALPPPPSAPVQAVPTPVQQPVQPTSLPPHTSMVNNTDLGNLSVGTRKSKRIAKM